MQQRPPQALSPISFFATLRTFSGTFSGTFSPDTHPSDALRKGGTTLSHSPSHAPHSPTHARMPCRNICLSISDSVGLGPWQTLWDHVGPYPNITLFCSIRTRYRLLVPKQLSIVVLVLPGSCSTDTSLKRQLSYTSHDGGLQNKSDDYHFKFGVYLHRYHNAFRALVPLHRSLRLSQADR